MRTTGITLVFLISLFLTACIEPFVPNLNVVPADVYVVSGEVTNIAGYQNVIVSKASSITKPQYLPLDGCAVTIEDDKGNTFSLEGTGSGTYRVWMNQESLVPGVSYRLQVKTPTGESIESEFDRMPAAASLDSVYYVRKDRFEANTLKPLQGLQFYVDFHSNGTETEYFRWVAEETWEYHAPLPLEYYYDGAMHRVWPPDYSNMICWMTKPDEHIFSLSTVNLASNHYKMFPVQYVDNTTNRLLIHYSVLMSQHSLSQAAFVFWEQLRINSDEQGGLYEKQPLPVEGNLHNLSHPEKKVIGFFGASSVSQKRIFVDGINDMNIGDGAFCSPEELGIGGWLNITPQEYPIAFIYDKNGLIRTLQKACTDCRALGGTLLKPEFWAK
jgi:hypothetical protein